MGPTTAATAGAVLCALLLAASARQTRLASGHIVSSPSSTATATATASGRSGGSGPSPVSPIHVFYSKERTDNIAAVTNATIAFAKDYGYGAYGVEGTLINTSAPGLVQVCTYWSASMQDTLTTGSAQGIAWATNPANGYVLLHTEGYCLPNNSSKPHQSPSPSRHGQLNAHGTQGQQLVQYWSEARNDTFLVVVGSPAETSAQAAGYKLMWSECHIPAQWTPWADASAQKGSPFPKSEDLLGWEYLSGAIANYGGADTWYPSWSSDGNLYTPFTDGVVNGVRSGSGGKAGAGWNSTTGIATVSGDDPFNLTVTQVHTFTSSTFPYKGRYPCGSLSHNGVWYYGTYYLDNPNGTTPQGDPLGPNPGPNCGNWCIQGPFVDFRYSTDNGETWVEPRVNATGPTDNVFGESATHNQKVKFGAPHVVDFGQNMAHSPDGKVYIVGHGASRPKAIQAWMLGDEVYLARVAPAPTSINNRSEWEFYSGGEGAAAVWTKGNVSAARPLITWLNHTGVVTMSYHPALRKYILVVGTASFYPSMVKQFDTYFLESDSITGPWKMITYLSELGPEAYFVHFPTKFMAAEVDAADHRYSLFLSYSANFAFHEGADPVGSGYHWSLQQSRLQLSPAFAAKLQRG